MATLAYEFTTHTKDVNSCSFSSNSKYLASASGDKTVRLWDISDGSELEHSPLKGHNYSITSCVFSPFGSVLATGSQDYTIILWDIESGEQIATLNGHKGIIRCLSFSHNSQYLVSASSDETACIWDVKTYSLLRKLTGPEVSIMTCRFTPDDLYVVCGSVYGDIRIWEVSTGKYENMVQAHDAGLSGVGITGCDFSPKYGAAGEPCPNNDGESPKFLLATCGGDNLLKLWNVNTASAYSRSCNFEAYSVLEGHSGHVWDCKFSSNGKLLASCSSDKTVILWEPIHGKILEKISAHSRYIMTLSISPDGQFFATGSNDKLVRVWKLKNVNPVLTECSYSQQGVPVIEPSAKKRKKIRTWTVAEVCDWLIELSLDQYCDVFRDNVIDGVELVQMNDQTLAAGLGITPIGHRNKILRELASLKKIEVEGNIPDEFLCPITREIMSDPVVLADGYTYERSAIVMWINSGKNTSPMTNTTLPHINLIPNRPLKSAIYRFFGPEPLNFIV